MCTPGALDIFREVRLYTTLWGQDRKQRKSRVPTGDMGLEWRSLGGCWDPGGCFHVLCGWGGGLVPSQCPCPSPSVLGQEVGCGSPLTLQPQAGWQHPHWVLRMVWLGKSTWQGRGKGTGTWSEVQPVVFPQSPLRLPWFSVCAVVAGAGRKGVGSPWQVISLGSSRGGDEQYLVLSIQQSTPTGRKVLRLSQMVK